jgi:serine/threonine protein phosphatase PrpC
MSDTPAPTARAQVVGMTDVGRVREHNEDSFLVMNRADGRRADSGESFEAQLDGALLLVVCDGMGGAAAGEIASRMAADRMAAELGKADFGNSTPDQIASVMDRAVQQANQDIHDAAKANPAQKGMGTTMTAAVVTPGRLFVSQVGDSRAYLLRKGLLNQITKDQSLIGQLIEEGTLTEEEAEKLGGRNIVLQAVGVEENLRVDTKYWPLLRGDVLLVCSDGLSGMVKDARMKEILAECGDDMQLAAKRLIEEANKNGGRDNITNILARFDGDGLRPPMEAAGEGAVEKAGVAFKAPPPPEVPNPMRRVGWLGLGLLAAIGGLFFVLRPTTAAVQIATRPAGVSVHVTLVSESGERYEADAKGDVAVMPSVKPSDKPFTLTASAPGGLYEDDQKQVDIRTPGQVHLDVAPVPKPGTVAVTSKTPRVRVRIEAPGSHRKVSAYDQSYDLPEADQKREFGNIPSGDVTVTATRTGFREWRKKAELTPTGSLSFDVPPLEEVKGRLVVDCAENGVEVEVFDDHGDLLGKDEVRDHEASFKVRVGRHSVRATKRGFQGFDAPVEVSEGGDAKLTVSLEVTLLQVMLLGPPNSEFRLLRAQNSGEPLEVEHGSAAGRSKRLLLPPGNYTIEWSVGGVAQDSKPLPLRVGDKPREVPLEPKKR